MTRSIPLFRMAAELLLLVTLLGPGADAAAEGPDYDFTVDWTSKRGDVWTRHLGKFKGKPDVQGLEVGCLEGRSTLWFLDNILTHPPPA